MCMLCGTLLSGMVILPHVDEISISFRDTRLQKQQREGDLEVKTTSPHLITLQ